MGKVLQRFGEPDQFPRRPVKGKNKPPPIPDYLDWMVWRLILNKVSTLHEIETHYDLVNVLDAHAALDWHDEAEYRACDI